MPVERKEIKVKLADGKEYLFSERNKEDVDYSVLQDKVRATRFKFLQENIPNEERLLTLLMFESKRVYSESEIRLFLFSNNDELRRFAYDSFKVKNNSIPFEDFKKLLPVEDVPKVIKIINLLETDETLKKKMTDR